MFSNFDGLKYCEKILHFAKSHLKLCKISRSNAYQKNLLHKYLAPHGVLCFCVFEVVLGVWVLFL